MHLACHCLNVALNVIIENERLQDVAVKAETLQLSEDAFDDPFFLEIGRSIGAVMIKEENAIHERYPVLVRKRSLDNWEFRKCMLCNMYTYATNSSLPGRVLVSLKMLSDESAISERRKCADFSSVYQVVLPKRASVAPTIDTYTTAGNGNNGFNSGANGVSRNALHVVQDVLAQCLKREQQAVDERIQKYADEQHAAFEQFKTNAKAQRATLVALLASNSGEWSYYEQDDENDSAVPLSPLSLHSGDPSPAAYCGAAYQQQTQNTQHFNEYFAVDAFSRPKALSNPACLSSWKRKRHSGGSGKAPALISYPEEQQDIFSFEEHETTLNGSEFYHLSADDEDDADDSGVSTSGGDYSKFYPVNGGFLQLQQEDMLCSNNDVFGKSLPMSIAGFGSGGEMDEQRATPNADVGESMLALAKSIQAEDDPERLFGERPHRRRYKTTGAAVDSHHVFHQRNNENDAALHRSHHPVCERLVITTGTRRPFAF